MLKDLDKKLNNTINKKIEKLENKKKFNIFNSEIMSISWVFVFNIFIFAFFGYYLNNFIKKFINCGNFIFIIVFYIGIYLSCLHLIKTLKKHNCI